MGRTDRARNTPVNAGVVLLSLALALLLVEGALRAGVLDEPENPRPVWIPPPRYKAINLAVNERKKWINEKNFFPFTDIVRSQRKRPGHARIAVLGDSFIWGDGLEADDIWSRKLERKIADRYGDVEVVSWGISGWSTAVEAWFLESYGTAFHPDCLIVGFVTNDPDFGTVERKEFRWHRSAPFQWIRLALPLTADCFAKYLNRFLEARVFPDRSYEMWENPGNGHPGPAVTELFAAETCDHLRSRGILSDLVRRARAAGEAEPRGLRRLSPAPRGDFLRLRRWNEEPAPEGERVRIEVRRTDRHLFLEGKAIDAVTGGGAGGVYVEIDGRLRLPACYGPTYSLVRPSLRNDEFEQVPGTETDFKIHVPLDEIGGGAHILTFLVLSREGRTGWRPAKTILLNVR